MKNAVVRDDVSDTTSSASEGLSDPPPQVPVKKRKATYYQRKEEIEALEQQVQTLEAKLKETQQNSLVATNDALLKMDPMTLRAVHDEAIVRNNLKLAGTQAMLSSYQQTVGSMDALVPLTTYIHLPADPTERRKVMLSHHAHKLHLTSAFMAERTRGLNLSVGQSQKENFDFPNGDLASTGFMVTHYANGHTLRQVFEAFMFFVANQEISLSEELGVITVRDEDDEVKEHCCQARFVTTLPAGLEIEYNAAMFASLTEGTVNQPGCAIGVIDYVNEDDLYPYHPDTRGRKELTGAMVMTELPSPTGRPIIAQSWWYYVRFRPPYPLDERTQQCARNNVARWHEVASKVIRDRLATVEPA